jgi:hypothetical protein
MRSMMKGLTKRFPIVLARVLAPLLIPLITLLLIVISLISGDKERIYD